MARRHTRPKERKKPRSIPQELKENQKVRKEYKRTPMMPLQQQEDVREESPVAPEMRMMPEPQHWDDKGRESQPGRMIPEIEEFDIRAHERKKTKERRKKIKKNVKKGWKELGLLEKRGLA